MNMTRFIVRRFVYPQYRGLPYSHTVCHRAYDRHVVEYEKIA